MRPAPSGIDGASTEFTCICARATTTRGHHGEGGRWRARVKGMKGARMVDGEEVGRGRGEQ